MTFVTQPYAENPNGPQPCTAQGTIPSGHVWNLYPTSDVNEVACACGLTFYRELTIEVDEEDRS